jgi:Tfp pilus assembly protein PilX
MMQRWQDKELLVLAAEAALRRGLHTMTSLSVNEEKALRVAEELLQGMTLF